MLLYILYIYIVKVGLHTHLSTLSIQMNVLIYIYYFRSINVYTKNTFTTINITYFYFGIDNLKNIN